ncbi:phosphate ABC transporter substrate-binding protein PstS family protein [Vibrio rumoiensis]
MSFSFLSYANPTYTDELPSYQKVSGVSDTISSVGSDTLATLMTLWAQEFQSIYPNINMQVQASGSSTAPTALTEGTSQLGPMSRPMKAKEIEAFERQYGYPPIQLKVAIDAIGIFVHKDNPIKGLNFEQLDAIFSSTMQCGATRSLDRWQQLGIQSDWARLGFQLFGRNSVSGTYGYFKQHALCGGDFKRGVNEQPGSASVVQSVASSINSIGYSGVGYQVSKARLVPLAQEGSDYVAPTRDNILTGHYPLARYLYVYVNKNPLKPLPRNEAEFLKFIFSKQGQIGVEKDGYVPLSSELAESELKLVGLSLK